MISIKTKKEIEIMREGGWILAKIMAEIIEKVQPGVKTKDLDKLAERLVILNKAEPSFKMVKNYQYATCININEGLVHGIPGDYRIKSGDVVTVDLGVYYKGFHTDMARTFQVRIQNDERERFLEVGRLALKKATQAAQPGNRVGHISQVIQEMIEKTGYSCSRKFTGHGIGKNLHEEPSIPCFLKKPILETSRLKDGMVLAIEVIYAQGRSEVKIDKDGWTSKTVDGQLGGLFEDTVAICKAGPSVLTMI